MADLFNGFGTNDALQKSKIVDIMLHGGDVKQLGGLATGASAEALRIFESVSSQVRGSDFMGSGFIETLKSGKFIGLDGKPIKIDPSELSKIQAALRSNAVSGVTDSDGNAIAKFDELLRTIKEGKTLSASSPEMEKLIKILSQNAEMDKQVKGELRNLKAGLESSKAKSKK